jgi:inosine-uridine nucleoside N-ribohydrolase
LTRGMTIVDRLNVAHDANNAAVWKRALDANVKADICWTIDAARFKAQMIEALK